MILTDGKAGTVDSVWLDEMHGLRVSIRGQDGKWVALYDVRKEIEGKPPLTASRLSDRHIRKSAFAQVLFSVYPVLTEKPNVDL